jgi:hypothetical protein
VIGSRESIVQGEEHRDLHRGPWQQLDDDRRIMS